MNKIHIVVMKNCLDIWIVSAVFPDAKINPHYLCPDLTWTNDPRNLTHYYMVENEALSLAHKYKEANKDKNLEIIHADK